MDQQDKQPIKISRPLIVSIKRARRLLGKGAKTMSDEEIKTLILKLDEVATEYIRAVPDNK